MRRVLIISHAYLAPANRGKLRALASRGLDVTVGVPRRGRRGWWGKVRGRIAGGGAAPALRRRVVRDLPVAAIPQLGIQVPTEPQHMHHEGVAIGCIGRLVPEKGVDTLLQFF